MPPFDQFSRFGPAEAPVIVLLHGASLSRVMWGPVIATLESRYRLLVPDLPGHASREGRFTMNQAVADVTALLEQEAPDGAVLAGDSLGGYVALATAARAPERVRGVLASGAAMSFQDARLVSWLMTLPVRIILPLVGEGRLRARVLEQVRATFPKAPVEAMMAEARLGARNDAIRDLLGFDVLGAVAAYPGRIHFVNGELDTRGRRHEARFLAAARQGTAEIMAGLPHGVSLADPDGFAAIVDRFTKSLS